MKGLVLRERDVQNDPPVRPCYETRTNHGRGTPDIRQKGKRSDEIRVQT